MICIGVCGKGSRRVADQLCRKYSEAGIGTEKYMGSSSFAEFEKFVREAESTGKKVIISETSLEDDRRKYDILIMVSADLDRLSPMKNIRENGYIIINADDCGIFSYILPQRINIVTCGVNSSASVTFSGIGENRDGRESLQCCIQREIKTVSGRKIEPQEFSVNIIGLKYPISEVLAITTAAITGDIEETVTSDTLI